MLNGKLMVSPSPHIYTDQSTRKIMLDVIIALTPAFIGSIIFFGMPAVTLTLLAIVAAVATEAVIQKLTGRAITIGDLSAVVTGLLLAFNLPPTAPWWIPVIGSIVAIAVMKQAFGGIGNNFINPALAARAVLVASWGGEMTRWVDPVTDTMTSATPLAFVKSAEVAASNPYSLFDLFIGRVGGCLGETSALLLIIGGLYLIARGVISWRVPVSYIGSVFVLTWVLGMIDPSLGVTDPVYHILAGGLMLGAFYMATDYASSPVTPKGKIIFGIGCGVITTVIRLYGGYPGGVSYAILLMNVASPIIEKLTRPRVYGEVK